MNDNTTTALIVTLSDSQIFNLIREGEISIPNEDGTEQIIILTEVDLDFPDFDDSCPVEEIPERTNYKVIVSGSDIHIEEREEYITLEELKVRAKGKQSNARPKTIVDWKTNMFNGLLDPVYECEFDCKTCPLGSDLCEEGKLREVKLKGVKNGK